MGSPCSDAVSLSKRTTSISSASSGMVERTKVRVEMITTVIDVNAHICEYQHSALFAQDTIVLRLTLAANEVSGYSVKFHKYFRTFSLIFHIPPFAILTEFLLLFHL